MIELPKFKDIDWYTDTIKRLLVNGNIKESNFIRYYETSKQREKMEKAILQVLPPSFKMNGLPVIDRLITASFDELVMIKNYIDSTNYNFQKLNDWNLFKKKYNAFVAKKNNVELVKKYGIKCCPYCNENFIFNREDKAGCQLDHFFPKDKYPVFAICLNNLVPVCSTCNHIKSDRQLRLSPHDHSKQTAENRQGMHISYELTSFSWPYTEDSISSVFVYDQDIDSDFKKDMDNDIELLQLDSSYEHHKDYIIEIVNKAYMYNNACVKSLVGSFGNMFTDEWDVYRYIFGNYCDQVDFLKRPLSKLTKDMLIELDIIESV